MERLDELVGFTVRNTKASEATAENTQKIQRDLSRLVELSEERKLHIDFGQVAETLSQFLPATSPLPQLFHDTLEEFKQYHTQLYEWKELHHHLNGIIMVFRQFSLQMERLSDNSKLKQNLSLLLMLWEPALMKIMPLLEWARYIQYIGTPFEELSDGSLKGEKWAIEIRIGSDRVTELLRTKTASEDLLRDAVDELWQQVNTHMFLADDNLRKTAGELFNLSRIALGSINGDKF